MRDIEKLVFFYIAYLLDIINNNILKHEKSLALSSQI